MASLSRLLLPLAALARFFSLSRHERLAGILLSVFMLCGAGYRIWLHHRQSQVLAILPPAPTASIETLDELPPQPVLLNTADREQLERLPGIGPTRADAILEYRRRHGNFRSLDELDQVPGIGPGTIERVKPFLVLEAAASGDEPPPVNSIPETK